MKGTRCSFKSCPARASAPWGACPVRALFVLGLLLGTAAQAQRAVVVTASLSTTRQSARIYAQAVNLGTGEALSGGAALPGSSLAGPSATGIMADPVPLPGGFAALSTGPSEPALHPDPSCPETGISLIHTWPLAVSARRFHESEAGWREWAADRLPDPAAPGLLVLGTRAGDGQNTPTVGRGRLFGGSPDAAKSTMLAEWPLPGSPVAGVWTAALRSALVLCAGTSGGEPVLVKCDLGAPQTVRRAAGELAGWNSACTDARALVGLPDTDCAVAAFSGRSLGAGSTEPLTQMFVLDAKELRVVAGPVDLRGMAERIHVAGDGSLWVASRAPGTDFAYATQVRVDPASATAVVETEYALTGAMEGFLLAPAPGRTTLAVSLGARLEIWPDGKRGEVRAEYGDAIRALCWAGDGLLVGEAGRVHVADPDSGASRRSVQLQTGQVAAFLPVPPDAPKSAVSGPRKPGNRIVVPPAVLLRGEAAGRELRALTIDSDGAPGPWRIHYDPKQMPWLVIHPTSGHGSGTVYLGVDPARYPPHTLAEGRLSVSLEGGSPPIPAVDSPAGVLVRVEPAPVSARIIFWLWPEAAAGMRDPSDPHGLSALATQLAATPQYFSHAESSDPVTSPLTPYAVIVLQAGAAVRGVLPRQALVDYVADGGGLLVVGGADKAQAESLGPWIAPFGVTVLADPPPPADAVRPRAAHPLLRYWPAMRLSAAYGFRAFAGGSKDAFAPQAMKVMRVPAEPADTPALFLARSFGYGRVALLASDAPLRAARNGGAPEDFARELFVWLAGAGVSAQDMDRDGLTDDLEDVNGNGVRDPGETNWLRADTDADGVPDGLEDWNRNGTVDSGETDPRNADTDGDTVWDGADTSAASVFGAPRIAGLVPYAGPAEGGGIVLVRGEGLLPGAEYRFGDQPAECIAPGDGSRALVRVPDGGTDAGGPVNLSVVLPGRGLRAELPGGYQYLPRSRARIALVPVGPVKSNGETVQGRFRVVLSVTPACPFANVALSVGMPAASGFSWRAEPSGNPSLQISTNPAGDIVVLGESRSNGTDRVTLAEIDWTCTGTPGGTIDIPAPRALVQAAAGGRLLVETAGLSVSLP